MLFSFFTLISLCFASSISGNSAPEAVSELSSPLMKEASNLELLIPPWAIAKKLRVVGAQIDKEYKDEELVVIMVMKGALIVSADLIRNLHIPVSVDYVKAKSYGKRGISRGELSVIGLEELDITGKNVLVVDDIFDSGVTMTTLVQTMQAKKPKTLRSLVLLLKQVPREITYRPDYVLFEIPNRFVVGYGLDYKEHYRGLRGIFAFVNDTPPDLGQNAQVIP
jgi:hypoxanthine phosphoribosyltransferase